MCVAKECYMLHPVGKTIHYLRRRYQMACHRCVPGEIGSIIKHFPNGTTNKWDVFKVGKVTASSVLLMINTFQPIHLQMIYWQCQKVWSIYRVISEVYSTIIVKLHLLYTVLNKTTFTIYCPTQWPSKLHLSFEIHWIRSSVVNFTGRIGRINATVNRTEPVFTRLRHGKLS